MASRLLAAALRTQLRQCESVTTRCSSMSSPAATTVQPPLQQQQQQNLPYHVPGISSVSSWPSSCSSSSSTSSSCSFALLQRRNFANKPGGGASRSKAPSRRRRQDQKVSDEQDGHIPRSSRIDIVDCDEFDRDGKESRRALTWQRREVQQDPLVEDTYLPSGGSASWSSSTASAATKDDWWRSWEPEFDEGWDWEDKWHPSAGQHPLEPRDDPRRPKGPLIPAPLGAEGDYRSVPMMNHRELVQAMVNAAFHDPVEELVWQAMCHRAEIVAVSMTPAEVVATVRCVTERPAGQLRLLWKMAGLVVEKLSALTPEDLVRLADCYSKLDTVHHGLLNVAALVLADAEDERALNPDLAVKILSSFARANYRLPLLILEAKRIILDVDSEIRSRPFDLPDHISKEQSVSALRSLSSLGALESASLTALLLTALSPARLLQLREGYSDDEQVLQLVGPEPALDVLCSTCQWAFSALDDLAKVSSVCAETDLRLRGLGHNTTGEEGLQFVLSVTRQTLGKYDCSRLRLIPSSSGLRCLLPLLPGCSGDNGLVESQSLLDTARLLSRSPVPGDIELARSIFIGACGRPQLAARWPLQEQVQWLDVAVRSDLSLAQAKETVLHLLDAIAQQEKHRLVPVAADIFVSLPALLSEGSTATVAKLAAALLPAAEQQHYRLSLRQAEASLRSSLDLLKKLREEKESAAKQLQPLTQKLLETSVRNLPAKCRSESVFSKDRMEGLTDEDVVSWSLLLSKFDLLVEAYGGCEGAAPPAKALDEAWKHLSQEASAVIIRTGEPTLATAALLRSFATEGERQGWSAVASADEVEPSPLAVVGNSVKQAWARAITVDGEELEDEEHEPLTIAADVEEELRAIFTRLGLFVPTAPQRPPPGPAALRRGASASTSSSSSSSSSSSGSGGRGRGGAAAAASAGSMGWRRAGRGRRTSGNHVSA